MYAKLIKDNFVKLTRMAAIGTATASLTLVSTVPPSFAAPPPSCVNVTNQSSRSITVRNNCRTQQRVKVVIASGPDKGCKVFDRGEVSRVTWTLGRFDKLEKC